jgi:glycosyltransferase involved in cell wall biosynthesis
MRIAIDAQPLYTHSRLHGIGRYVSNLIRTLPLADPSNEYFAVGIRNSGLPEPDIPDTVEMVEIDIGLCSPKVEFFDTEHNPLFEERLHQVVRRERIDLYHATSPLSFDTILPETPPCRFITTAPDIIPYILGYIHRWPPAIVASYFRRINLVKRYAEKIITFSNCTKNDLIRQLDIPSEKISVANLAVDPHLTSQAQELRAGDKGNHILYVGNYDGRKNIESLILAYGKLPSDLQKSFSLVIDCEADLPIRKRLEDLAAGVISGNVILVSPKTDFELADLYKNASLLVFPSLYEGFGLPPLEAMAQGIPVVASNASSIPEVVGDAAVLFDPKSVDEMAEKIRLVLTDGALREKLVEAGRSRVNQFSWLKCARETSAVYKSCLAREGVSMPRKIAFLSPLNPQASGISDYSEELLEYLKSFFEIDVYVDGFEPANPHIRGSFTVRDISELEQHIAEYGTCVYNMSNNAEYHMSIYREMNRYPGITILHEYSCHPAFYHAYLVQSRNEAAYLEEMALSYGAEGVVEARRVISEGSPNLWNYPLNGKVLLFSKGVIMHVPIIAHNLQKKTITPILGIPHGVKAKGRGIRELREKKLELRSTHGIPHETFVVSTMGFLSQLRRLDVCLKAFSRLREELGDCQYLIAGHFFDAGLREQLEILISSLGIESHVILHEFEEHVTIDKFEEWMQLCDVLVNLRYPSPGAPSGTLARALALAKPVIASNIEDFAHYPNDCVWKVEPDETEQTLLFRYLLRLARDKQLREKMEENALAYAKQCDWSIVSKTMSKFVRRYQRAL